MAIISSASDYLKDITKAQVIDLKNPNCNNCSECCSLLTMITPDEFEFYCESTYPQEKQ